VSEVCEDCQFRNFLVVAQPAAADDDRYRRPRR
jgi:hypothetical protein